MDPRPRHRRLLVPALAAVVFAAQATGGALALAGREAPTVARALPQAVVDGWASDARRGADASRPRVRSERMSAHVAIPDRTAEGGLPSAPAVRVTTPTAQTAPVQISTTTKAPPRATAPKASGSAAGQAGSAYRGRNHVWIPSLGVSRDVVFFPCPRSKPPGHQIYLWGCAGRNNVYLFGHAASVMRALHDAYYSKRLKVGMKVVYADGNGRVRTYKVTTWKVLSPVDSAWAIAAQSRPSMTLQTCVGANSQWRLVVRLVQSG
jgi:hypothetical protein